MTALSMYAKLNEERQNIIKNIVESGTIYRQSCFLDFHSIHYKYWSVHHAAHSSNIVIIENVFIKSLILEDFHLVVKIVLIS